MEVAIDVPNKFPKNTLVFELPPTRQSDWKEMLLVVGCSLVAACLFILVLATLVHMLNSLGETIKPS